MILKTIFSTTPFVITAILAASEGRAPAYLEYGALGLCALCVVFLCAHIKYQANELSRKDQILGELYKENTQAYHRLADLLGDRPCLMKDKRIQGDKIPK